MSITRALGWSRSCRSLSWNAILPVSSEFWYQSSEKLQLGLVLGLDGNDYHGDPDIFSATDPQLRYSVVTLGTSLPLRSRGLVDEDEAVNEETAVGITLPAGSS